MKFKIRKMMALVIAMVMVLAMSVTVFAGEIKVTPPDGTQADSSNTYKVYKVFDAITDGNGHYSYKLTENQTTVPTGFILDDAGNVYLGTQVAKDAGDFNVTVGGTVVGVQKTTALNDTLISAIAGYVKEADLIDTKVVTGTSPADFTGLGDGYYYVTTTTGTLVIVDTTQPVVDIKDKNEVPPLTKKITAANSVLPDDTSTEDIDEAGKKAIAQVGTEVEYTVTVTKKKGAENYEVHDTMGTGLKYKKDVAITVGEATVDAANYTKTETDTSLVVSFDNDYMAGLADDTVITLVYHATVTSEALQVNHADNTAYLSYGHTPGQNKTPTVTTETYNAKFSVTKKDGDGENLAGAGFVLKNSAGKYYKFTAASTDGTTVTPATVTWVDSVANATEYTSTATGTLNGEFTGLPNGTYTLIENTVPNGYNKAADYEFTVNGADVEDAFESSNLIQNTTVINNQGAELPSTGGIGTTIFYIVGVILVLGAGILLVTRRRMNTK